jgi:hypothetical protein
MDKVSTNVDNPRPNMGVVKSELLLELGKQASFSAVI